MRNAHPPSRCRWHLGYDQANGARAVLGEPLSNVEDGEMFVYDDLIRRRFFDEQTSGLYSAPLHRAIARPKPRHFGFDPLRQKRIDASLQNFSQQFPTLAR